MTGESATSPRAQSSFRLGLASLLLTAITGIPAIVQGVRGLREIGRDPVRLTGRGRAWTGIGTGLFGTALGVYLLMLAIDKVQETADRTH